MCVSTLLELLGFQLKISRSSQVISELKCKGFVYPHQKQAHSEFMLRTNSLRGRNMDMAPSTYIRFEISKYRILQRDVILV